MPLFELPPPLRARQGDPLRGVFLRHWRMLGLSALLLLATMLAGVGLLGLSGWFLTGAALAGGLGSGFNFFSPSAGIRALTLVRIASRYGEKLVGHDTLLRIGRDLRVWFFRRALPLAPARLGATRTGDLLARLMSDIGQVESLQVRALAPLAALVVIGVAATAVAACWYLPAGLLLAGLAVVIGVAVPWVVARGQQVGERLRAELRAELRTLAYEGLEGAADLDAMRAVPGWQARVDAAAARLAQSDLRQRRRLYLGNLLHSACAALGLLAMLALLVSAAQAGSLAPPVAAALFFATLALLEVWAGAGQAWQALQAGRASARRLLDIAEQPPAVADPPAARARELPQRATVRFEQVVFAWPDGGRRVLDGVDLAIAPGERIAISGDSGCGKSTLSALLLRLWDPQSGCIRFGEVDLREVPQALWHQRIAWLPQNAPVFAGSVADNLRLGDPAADDAALWEVLRAVRLDAWAQAAGGLQAWVGENGATMSAGQARRLALARALLRRAPLLVLDEPTEGLDFDTAHALLQDLPALLQGRSLLMISHGEVPEGTVGRRYRLQDGTLRLQD